MSVAAQVSKFDFNNITPSDYAVLASLFEQSSWLVRADVVVTAVPQIRPVPEHTSIGELERTLREHLQAVLAGGASLLSPC